jgi:phosphatidylinositol 4-kinase type 2
MPKNRPTTSGYARLAQTEEEDDILEDSDHDDIERGYSTLSTPGTRYAPIQPNRRQDRMNASGRASPSSRRPPTTRKQRSNSGVDIKAINARLERWADEIASKFKRRKKTTGEEEQPEIQHSVFQAPDWIRPATPGELTTKYADPPGMRMSKVEFDDIVESVRVAIELGTHPKLISQGSSGSYFAQTADGKVVGVFKPKDEEPYASRNPKWTKWIHRNLFPFFFGRACLIPNLSYVSEAAAYVLDVQLRTNLVPYTEVISLSSKSFFYDFWDRRAYYRKKKPLPDKLGSLQIFLKGYKDATVFLKEHPWPDQHNSGFRTNEAPKRKRKRRWAEDCRPGGRRSEDEDGDEDQETTAEEANSRRGFWTDALQQSFREQLEKLVILDYIMRNTDRGLDNWMIRIDQKEQTASIVTEPPRMDPANEEEASSSMNGQPTPSMEQYRRQEKMSATSRSATPMHAEAHKTVRIGAIDNSLSWPWKHPDAVRLPSPPDEYEI